MARKPPVLHPPAPRRRRTAEEARAAILDATERMLVAAGPGGIRLQEVAAEVGVSHPTVLHHFGNREALVEAVVTRALASLHARLVDAVRAAPAGEDQVAELLDGVFDALNKSGHGRALVWLALEGHPAPRNELGLRAVAEAVHAVRTAQRTGRKRIPPLEETLFAIMLAGLSVLGLAVVGEQLFAGAGLADDPAAQQRFRHWLAGVLVAYFEKE